MDSETSYRPPYHPVSCEQVYGPTRLPAPPHETVPGSFPRATATRYRLNLLVTDGNGDSLYFAYSRSHVARYRIHRSNGIQLEALPATTIHPPTVINNMRVAHFAPHRGGDLLLMTGGSELTGDNGTLSIMPLPQPSSYPKHRNKRIRRGRSTSTVSSVRAHTFTLPVRSAWGLAVHDETCRIAVSSNSHSVLLLSITTSNTFVNVDNSGGISGGISAVQQPNTGLGTVGGNAGTASNIGTSNNDSNNNHSSGDDGDGSDDDYENRDGDIERRFRLVPISEDLQGTHRNNIPCVAFNDRGDRLASASIDTTFAVYDLSYANDPYDMIMDLFVPRVSGRMLYQNTKPLCPSRDGRTSNERMWGVHWTSRAGLPVLQTSRADASTIERFYIQQVHNMWWIPSELMGGDDLKDEEDVSKCIFRPSGEIAEEVRNPLSSGRNIVLYDDNNDFETSRPQIVQAETDYIQINKINRRELPSSDKHQIEGFTFFPESAKRRGWRKQTKKGRDDGFLLVALESKLRLYSIRENPNEEEADYGESDGAEGEKKGLGELVHELNLYWAAQSNGSNTQVMFTNIIEIEELRAYVLTGVGGGVFLIRIVDVDTDTGTENKASSSGREQERDDERDLQIEALGGPQLFVERVITTEHNVIGTCVVERKSECRSLRSFELWILEQDGKIQCWDLCERQSALDPSGLV